ncbi:hypothetical protein EBU71_03205 [bacterium]|nr:hypothetical protein [Candidatus Elulimicrobium humile]
MNKKRKLPILSRLKKKAPRIPEFTCPDIDHIMQYVEDLDVLKRGQLTYFKRRMEKLRSSNDSLRESGAYWYEEIKKILEK